MLRLRLITYEVLTQLIIWLGLLRETVMRYQYEQVRVDRVFDVYSLESWSCCDCGLAHRFRSFSDGLEKCNHYKPDDGLETIGHAWPIRPEGYAYMLRNGAGTPSLAKDKP